MATAIVPAAGREIAAGRAVDPDRDREHGQERADRAQGGGGDAEEVAERAGESQVGDGVGAGDDGVEA